MPVWAKSDLGCSGFSSIEMILLLFISAIPNISGFGTSFMQANLDNKLEIKA